MANYTLTNGSTTGAGTQQSVTTAYTQGTLACTCSTANGGSAVFRRGKIYDILLGTNVAPADTFIEWDISRVTASSTATFVAAQPTDSADAAHNCLAVVNSSAFPAVSIPNMWYFGMNQRASYRWVSNPGSELIWPATSSNGFVLRPRGNYTNTVTATWMFQEQ